MKVKDDTKSKNENKSPVFFDFINKKKYKLIQSNLFSEYYSLNNFKPEKFYKTIFKL